MKKHNKIISLLVILSMATCLFASSAQATEISNETGGFDESAHGEVLIEGTCGQNASFKLYQDENLYISGNGEIDRIKANNFNAYRTSVVYIEDGITSIGNGAFVEYDIKNVRLPNTLNYIGTSAFSSCECLDNITIPDSVETIGSEAFSYCSKMEYIKMPKNIQTIESKTFTGCIKLKNIVFPEELKTIESEAFSNCYELEEIEFPNRLEIIGNSAFQGCSNLKSIAVPNSVTTINTKAFQNCPKLSKALILDNVKTIATNAFFNCGSYNTPFVIYCNKNSEAERYAKENGYTCKAVSEWDKEASIQISNTFSGCKGSPVKISISCSESDNFAFECKDNCGMTSNYAGYSSISIGGAFLSYSKNYELIFQTAGEHIIFVYKNESLAEYDKVIISENHSWDDGKIVSESTCSKEGEKTHTCSVCKSTYVEKTPTVPHTLSDWQEIEDPSVFKEGTEIKTCTVCEEVLEERKTEKLKPFVKFKKSKITLKKGKSKNFYIMTKEANGDYAVKWSTSNKKVVSINKKNGQGKALKKGKAKITVKMKSGCKATCKVTVK